MLVEPLNELLRCIAGFDFCFGTSVKNQRHKKNNELLRIKHFITDIFLRLEKAFQTKK